MACTSPLKGYRAQGGKVTFDRTAALGTLGSVSVSCGQCRGCRLERSRQWAVRCVHESKMHSANCFITLTYDDAHLPPGGTLVLEHWQNFAKRMRKRLGPFRFYHCGEYGDETNRAHYHACIFGQDFSADRKPHSLTRNDDQLYTSDTLDDLWTHGSINPIGELTHESAAYVARYVMKKQTGKLAADHYDQVDTDSGLITSRKPEYSTMSRRPGIGKTWFDKFTTDVFPSDEVITKGRTARPPKFYDTQYEVLDPEGFLAVKAKRKLKGSRHYANNTPERLAIREEIQELKYQQLKRPL